MHCPITAAVGGPERDLGVFKKAVVHSNAAAGGFVKSKHSGKLGMRERKSEQG